MSQNSTVPECNCWGPDSNEPHLIVIFQAHIILSAYYLTDLPLRNEAQSHNLRFQTYLTLPHSWTPAKYLQPSQYFDQQLLPLFWTIKSFVALLVITQNHKACVPKLVRSNVQRVCNTNYHDTTDHSVYVPRFDLLWSHDILTAN